MKDTHFLYEEDTHLLYEEYAINHHLIGVHKVLTSNSAIVSTASRVMRNRSLITMCHCRRRLTSLL